jgi:hypothetical protein
MKKILFFFASFCISGISFAQCPDLTYAMVNACATGSTEGNNEFVVFKTFSSANVSTYKLLYGTGNPPLTTTPITNIKTLSGADAVAKTGTGSVTTTGGTCSVIEVTSPSTSIPANSTVLFVPANLDQNYDVTGLCGGAGSIYVVYINIIAGSATESSWSAGGTLANNPNPGTSRFLQVSYSGSISCGGSAPVKSYSNKWGANTDGNAVTWTATDTLYSNSGCTSPVLPVSMIDLTASNTKDANIIKWRTVQELNTEKFILERSFDGKNFSAVSNIAAIGSNSNNYQFADKISEYKTTYYRIKTIDKSGKSVYSRIVKVVPSRSNLTVSNIYPNPAKENISVEWNSLTKAKATVKIIDVTGRILQTENTMALTGYNKRTLNVNNLPPGKYIIQIATDHDVVTASFNK